MNFLIFNKRGDICEVTEAESLAKALDTYIEEYLVKNKSFSIENEKTVEEENTLWLTIVTEITNNDQIVAILNGFCTKEAYKITKIISGYSSVFEQTSTAS
jgi:hypothetical protein